MPNSLNTMPGLGLLATQWEAAKELEQSIAQELFSRLRTALPKEMLLDASADWTRWPGSQSPIFPVDR
jgi:hypothetical protein